MEPGGDIAVESVIDDWNLQNIRKSQSWIRQRTYRDLKEEIKGILQRKKNLWSTGKMEAFGQKMERMTREFTVDDHKYWAKDEDDEKTKRNEPEVAGYQRKMQTDMETFFRKKRHQIPGIFWIRSGREPDSDMTRLFFA